MDEIYGDLESVQASNASPAKPAAPEEVDDELAMLQQQVNDIQQDHALRQLHDTAAKEEGLRKKAPVAAATVTANTSIFVGGLDARTTESDLRLFFQPCGAIERVTVLKDKATGQPRGTAYVTFETEEAATAALLKDGQQCHGKPLKIAIKRDNVPAAMRGGRGGTFPPRGRGAQNFGQNAMNPMMQMMGAMMAAMGQQGGFTPYGPQRGRGGRGGRAGGPRGQY